ncbi:MAG: hypothetical protein CMD89_04725 [Gammaproteobacteria bacterium]|nr:hypothetical protein [Gammaproteobacteria bacterium]|tara:strand:- start:65 stop:667 length:603 start_codon:yes stop_codon:yes gene_type:complete
MRLPLYLFLISLFINSDKLCEYDSTEEEVSPVQITGKKRSDLLPPIEITDYDERVEFQGSLGTPAVHEGIDYINEDKSILDVPVLSAYDGKIVYIRSGCPESDPLKENEILRECGAGWGNHIVIKHNEFFTRYAHLKPKSIMVEIGQQVKRSRVIGYMGNSGRSDKRHLHFEIGFFSGDFRSCDSSQSFDFVVDPLESGF